VLEIPARILSVGSNLRESGVTQQPLAIGEADKGAGGAFGHLVLHEVNDTLPHEGN